MNNAGVIDRFLETFTSYIDSGFGLLSGEVAFLTSTLIVIDIVLAGLFWAWGTDEDIIQRLVKKTLYIGFFSFIIGNFNSLAKIVFESFSGLGLKAGGSSLSGSELLQPGRVAQVGIDAGNPILAAVGELTGYIAFFENFIQIFVLMVAWVVVLIAFFILAIQIFVCLIEFKLTTLAGFVLIPFALFNKTSFLAEKVLGNIVASGVKILVLAVIVGIGSGLFSEFTAGFSEQPTISEALSLVLGALALMGLSIFGTGIATGLVSGAPQLGAGAAVGTGLAAAGIGTAGFMATKAGLGAAAGGIGGAARGGAALAGGARTAYDLGDASVGTTGTGGGAAGMMGVAKAGAGIIATRGKEAASQAGDSLRSSYRSGQAAAWKATGGRNEVNPGGGGAAANDPDYAGSQSSKAVSGSDVSPQSASAPDWAKRMKRNSTMQHGVSTAAHTIRSGDHGGGSMSVSLNQDDR
ncbi:conjugal transfer protein TrbL [Agrobacterium tumefaciens str. Cherry 2E-2-2]|uniref:Conjugal transfer protein TrbL n=2 Tax=Agrobacterium TaxID=357 RepID=A0A1S7R7C8_9HYPH|nr:MULTISPECIES: P-type conjugative transfer protein TrbL [Agrobacterium]EMS96334.1 conjugal transfer protein TrbL [Agrobacterium tumefaciens str. Cherry 2E-2-2]AYM82165.1 conjugal transfer protein TrbL [Agrobacterium tumefaciens]NTE90325.1 P-type conjugative transfer protein TrbL [Agrobacterium tumefaciens]CUX18012.1 Conjugal transfer protein TrbL [Agrobacterium tumefaciens str. Kerr 14]CUX48180.1 Conjugal transfer protein TrbL [Agrobacterium deltaense Zutra 3/1]